MERRKTLLLSTLAAALLIFGGAAVRQSTRKSSVVVGRTIGFPSIGKTSAPIEIVLIEDFQCKNCRAFSKQIIPKIQEKYIQSGKVKFTLVPVSFLAGSQVVANAALEVHQQNPSKFFVFLKSLLNHDGEVKVADLIRLARRMGGIDLSKLEKCIENGCHNQELAKNLEWATEIMGGQFRTPALYVNGAPGSTYSFEAIQYQIDQILVKLMKWFRENTLYLAWVIALIALLGSVYYGEVRHMEPCRLCWYQRIGMFPLALFLGFAFYKNEQKIALYSLPLVAFGGLFASYQSLTQLFPSLQVAALCGEISPCALAGYTPYLSFLAFASIGILISMNSSKKVF